MLGEFKYRVNLNTVKIFNFTLFAWPVSRNTKLLDLAKFYLIIHQYHVYDFLIFHQTPVYSNKKLSDLTKVYCTSEADLEEGATCKEHDWRNTFDK